MSRKGQLVIEVEEVNTILVALLEIETINKDAEKCNRKNDMNEKMAT